MNFYIVVEGDRSEALIYPKWIKLLNPKMSQVTSIADIKSDNFFLVSGHGYPNYLNIIRNAVLDSNGNDSIDRLVIAIDSEDFSVAEKTLEIESVIQEIGATKDTRIIVQEKCFESWCLGNRKIIQRNPQNKALQKFKQFYDVSIDDPAKMGAINDETTEAQFAFKYLSLAMQEKGIYYSKKDPRYVADSKFFFHLQRRLQDTNHIATFANFLNAFT